MASPNTLKLAQEHRALSAGSMRIIPSTNPTQPNRYARRKALQQYCRESGIKYQDAREAIKNEIKRREEEANHLKETIGEIKTEIETNLQEANSIQRASDETPAPSQT